MATMIKVRSIPSLAIISLKIVSYSLHFFFFFLSGLDSYDGDFLANVTRIDPEKVLEFGQGSVVHGRDSRYWDKDDRRRDDDYNEDEVEHQHVDVAEVKKVGNVGFYNEAGRNELNKYQAEYQASLDLDPNDDDAIDSQGDEYVDSGHDEDDNEDTHKNKPTEVKEHIEEKDSSKSSLEHSSLVSKGGKSGKKSRSDTKRRGRGRRSSGDNFVITFLDNFCVSAHHSLFVQIFQVHLVR